MPPKDIGSNIFYNFMLDTNTSQQDKHASLLRLFNRNATKAEKDDLRTEYSLFRGFLLGKHDTIGDKVKAVEDKLLDMGQQIDGGSPDKMKVEGLGAQQATELENLLNRNRDVENLLGIMFSAEAAAKVFFTTGATTETTSLYTESQEQDKKIADFQSWNTLMLQQLREPPAPSPAAPVQQRYSFGPDVIVLQKDIPAPERATFKKRIR